MSENISGHALFPSNYCRLCFLKQLFQSFLLFPGISIFKFLSGKSSQLMVSDFLFIYLFSPVDTTSAYCLSQILKYSDPLVNASRTFLVPGLRIPQGCLFRGHSNQMTLLSFPCCISSWWYSFAHWIPQYTMSWPVFSYFPCQSGSNISVINKKGPFLNFQCLCLSFSPCWHLLLLGCPCCCCTTSIFPCKNFCLAATFLHLCTYNGPSLIPFSQTNEIYYTNHPLLCFLI